MIRRVVSICRRYGFVGVAQRLRDKLYALFGRRRQCMELWAHGLEECSPEGLPAYQELFLADFEQHQADDPAWFTDEKLTKLALYYELPATRAFGCVVEGRLVAYGLISGEYVGYSKRRLRESDGYLWDGYTHPDFRGRGWHEQLIRIREWELRKMGKQRALAFVADFNRASRKGFQQAGYTLLKRTVSVSRS